jgi:transcription initiation factor TFIIB
VCEIIKNVNLKNQVIMLKNSLVVGPKCPSCGNKKIVTDQNTGELFCGKCGIVITDKIVDASAEWRSFSNEGGTDPTRTGAPTSLTMHDRGLSTIIGTVNKDASGKPLSTSMKSTIERLRTWDSRSQTNSSADRNLRQALNEMNKLKDKLSLSDTVIQKSAYIYRKALEKKLVRGRSIQGLVAACLYAACRNTETPRTLQDISNGMNVRKKDIARCYRLIFRELELKMPVVDPIKGVSRIASIAELGEKTKRKAIEILNQAKDSGLVAGKDPMGIAAASLYLACISTGEIKSQKEISIASGITEVTIRNRCAGLRKMLKN